MTETRRHLANINDSLRAEHANLKATKDHLLEHIAGLRVRDQKLQSLKAQLGNELTHSQQQAQVQQRTKEPLVIFLREQLAQLDKQYIDGNLRLKNLENEYQVCLLDYEKAVEVVTKLIEGAQGTEVELTKLKESDITMKAMIFDCERLKRVLQEEKRYFKELCQTQAKTHAQRLQELQSIRSNIKQEEDSSTCSIRLTKLHIGLLKLNSFFSQRITEYRNTLVRDEGKETKMVSIGIKSLENCLRIGTLKMRQNQKHLFRTWHNKVFPKMVLKDIAERALSKHEESRIKIQTLNKMDEQLLTKNTEMLHLFEKFKFIGVLSNKLGRKDKHYAFSIWREQTRGLRKIANSIQSAFLRTLPRLLIRSFFQRWNKNSTMLKRVQVGGLLLKEYENTRDLARCFRRWRFQLLDHQARCIKYYMQRMRDQQLITRRVNYQKRKMKILTMLQMKTSKIKLRHCFNRYWCNVKDLKSKELTLAVEAERELFSEERKNYQQVKSTYQTKDKNLLVNIFRDFVYKCKIVPIYKQWKEDSQHFKRQKRSLLSLVLRKQAKNKIYVMNEFRKCVQYYQKKEMHQVLTDLNHKMEAINQKSTQFREDLKTCIDNLGAIASRKIDITTSFVNEFQKRVVYNTYNCKRIKKTYYTFLLNRMTAVLWASCGRQTLATIRKYLKDNQQEIEAQKKATTYFDKKTQERHKKIFYWLKRQAVGHHQGFARMIHIENVFIFYRLTCAFAAIKRVYTAEKYKAMHKYLEDQGTVLKERQENAANLTNSRKDCDQALLDFFGKFVTYEDRKKRIKQREQTHALLSKYLTKFRGNVHNSIVRQKSVENMGDVLTNHQNMIFFRNLIAIRHEQLLQEVKQELAKINKKRKVFEEKNEKIRNDMQKRIEEEVKVYNECKEYYTFYSTRYENLLKYYEKRTAGNEQQYLKQQIFITWKYQYKASKRLISAIEQVFRRKWMKQPCDLAMQLLRNRISKAKAQDMMAPMFERKGNKLKLDAMSLWRANLRKMKEWEIQKRLEHLDQYEDQMKEEIKERAELISKETPRVDHRKLIADVFMAFKQVWLQKVTNRRKIEPMLERRKEKLIRDAMAEWKWDLFFIRTERSFIKYKDEKYALELKRDVFNSLKYYRYTVYNLVNKIKALNNNHISKLYQHSFNKIRNLGADQRDELNYQRKKALFTILSQKIAKLQRIQQRVLMKWNAQLIQRQHYLPTIVKRMELNVLKRAFALINEKKYWNEIYIKNIADEVTADGYNDINQVTNSLMREGYDPDEIKEYLKERNQKDQQILDKTLKHFRMWSYKEIVVRAFHSWKQYLVLKRNIKKALTKVFNIAGGIGKYWARWRTKDVHFNEVLKKESRGNMLNRYRELSRLLKEYHRDIRDNTANLEELQDINKEYKQKNQMAIMMALNVFSNSLKKGLLQGFNIWRGRIHQQRRVAKDEHYDQIISGLEMLTAQKQKLRYNIEILKQQNKQYKQKCMWGVQCGKILESLLTEKDSLSIDLADKEHNLKMLLEDNLRLKQKMKLAKANAERLISKVGQPESSEM